MKAWLSESRWRTITMLTVAVLSVLAINRIALSARIAALSQSSDYPTGIANAMPPPLSEQALNSLSEVEAICVNAYTEVFPGYGDFGNDDWIPVLLINHRPVLSRPSGQVEVAYVTDCWNARLIAGRAYVADYILWKKGTSELHSYSWVFHVPRSPMDAGGPEPD